MMENLMSAHGSLGGSDDGSGSGIQERKGGEGGNFQLPTTNCKNHVEYFTFCQEVHPAVQEHLQNGVHGRQDHHEVD